MQGEAHIVVPGSAVLYCSADVLNKPSGRLTMCASCTFKFAACMNACMHDAHGAWLQ